MRTCYTLLNKSVEKPKRWQYGQTAPYAGVDCCPGYGCRKATGIKVEKTGGIKVEKKDKVEKRKKEEEGRCRRRRCGGRSGSAAAPLELIAPKQLLGQRRVDEILVARFAADRREKVAESQFGIEWLVQSARLASPATMTSTACAGSAKPRCRRSSAAAASKAWPASTRG